MLRDAARWSSNLQERQRRPLAMDAARTAAARTPLLQPPAYLQPMLPYWLPPPTPPPEALAEKEKKDGDPWPPVDAQAAFLGPSLWDSQKDQQLKYTDLEDFLNEADTVSQPRSSPPQRVPGSPPLQVPPPPPQQFPQHLHQQQLQERPWPGALGPPGHHQHQPPRHPQHQQQHHHQQQQQQHQHPQQPHPQQQHPSCRLNEHRVPDQAGRDQLRAGEEGGAPLKVKVEFQVSPSDLALATVPGTQFDPQTHQFSDDELKPQAICKKSKKQIVPDERKDQRYWTRRQRNNTAAKRSRDARRLKENQIALRANFLEKENAALREVMDELNRKNQELKARVENCHCR
ncbi:hepatic leukemia factor-like isoform X3 [Amphibalanus amphitrite]|uniref:hepatic leukemia factor-like isoform X3 n=1 Tax=Amphibalanus amphitrite TaxID=1232801 RepID=UPI001C91481B|nr:hepatic leukemia factor-like isoform X3 [Amphibalanus amphitrite]